METTCHENFGGGWARSFQLCEDIENLCHTASLNIKNKLINLCGEERLSEPPLPAEEQNIQINQSEVTNNIPREGTKEGTNVQDNARRRTGQWRG